MGARFASSGESQSTGGMKAVRCGRGGFNGGAACLHGSGDGYRGKGDMKRVKNRSWACLYPRVVAV